MSVPFFLAPMATLSHRPLRELIESFGDFSNTGGCDRYFSEMIGAAPFLFGGRFEDSYADPLPCPERLVYQIVGGDAGQLAKAAAILDGRKTAGIDINMGCAAPEIVRTGAGVAWMRDIGKAQAMIGGVRTAVKGHLSVKLRIGWEESFGYLVSFCRMLEAEGVESLTLHPRLAGEKLRHRARWSYIERLRHEVSIPVAGNGDVDSPEALVERAKGPCDAVMVGRAAIQKPWIFARARALEAAAVSGVAGSPLEIDLEAVAMQFLDLLARHQPPEFWETRARRFFFYYCDNLKWSLHVKTLLNREKELGAMGAALRRHFTENPEERFMAV